MAIEKVLEDSVLELLGNPKLYVEQAPLTAVLIEKAVE